MTLDKTSTSQQKEQEFLHMGELPAEPRTETAAMIGINIQENNCKIQFMGCLASCCCFANPVSGYSSRVDTQPVAIHISSFSKVKGSWKMELGHSSARICSSPAIQVYNLLPPYAFPVWMQSQLPLQGAQDTLVSESKRVPLLSVASCTTGGWIFN